MTLHDLRAGALLVIEKLLWEDCMFKALDSCLREYSIPEKKPLPLLMLSKHL